MAHPFTTGRWSAELSSETFLSGLESCVTYTEQTGVETGFAVQYWHGGDILQYPDKIMVGEPTSVSVHREINSKQAREQYARETGTKVADLRGPATMETISALLKYREWLVAYNAANPAVATNISYPQTEDSKRREYEFAMAGGEVDVSEDMGPEDIHDVMIENPVAVAYTVHTHPSRRIALPSAADLASLNAAHRDNHTCGSGFRPVEIIVAAAKANHRSFEGSAIPGYSVLIAQEKRLLPRDTDWEGMSQGFQELREPLVQIFNAVPKGSYASAVADAYAIVRAIYTPGHPLSLMSGRWEMLAK